MSTTLPPTEKLQSARLMVVGDLMMDQYLSGHVERISPEAPVPVLKLESEEFVLGGGANVAKNLVALGCSPIVVGAVGDDGDAFCPEIDVLGLLTCSEHGIGEVERDLNGRVPDAKVVVPANKPLAFHELPGDRAEGES